MKIVFFLLLLAGIGMVTRGVFVLWRVAPPTPIVADNYERSGQCAEQAKKFEDRDPKYTVIPNHYSPKYNRRFVLRASDSGQSLEDAFEGQCSNRG